MTGSLFVVSGPSGTGKTTILRKVLERFDNLEFSVSYTTRSIRPCEEEGKDYFFVTKEHFEDLVNQGEFIEWARVHNNFYGTSKKYVDSRLEKGQNVILDIDVQGALNVLRERPWGVYVFVAPPSYHELERRLKSRGTERAEQLKTRLRNARWELTRIRSFQYVIINSDVNCSTEQLEAIVISEQLRVDRMKDRLHEAGLDLSEVDINDD